MSPAQSNLHLTLRIGNRLLLLFHLPHFFLSFAGEFQSTFLIASDHPTVLRGFLAQSSLRAACEKCFDSTAEKCPEANMLLVPGPISVLIHCWEWWCAPFARGRWHLHLALLPIILMCLPSCIASSQPCLASLWTVSQNLGRKRQPSLCKSCPSSGQSRCKVCAPWD